MLLLVRSSEVKPDDPPPKRRRVVSFYVAWIISFESNSEGYENPGFGCCPGMNYIFLFLFSLALLPRYGLVCSA